MPEENNEPIMITSNFLPPKEVVGIIREIVISNFDKFLLSEKGLLPDFKEKALNFQKPLPKTLHDFAIVSILLTKTSDSDKNDPVYQAMQKISDAYHSRLNHAYTDFEKHILNLRTEYGVNSHWGDNDFCLKVLKSASSPKNNTPKKNAL